jgi:hypothetical protein
MIVSEELKFSASSFSTKRAGYALVLVGFVGVPVHA